ncbi:hypothetical protein COCNU_contig69029333G000010 [Cocos nucifera]|nr:hypothetical protein [Cocos nucifera]
MSLSNEAHFIVFRDDWNMWSSSDESPPRSRSNPRSDPRIQRPRAPPPSPRPPDLAPLIKKQPDQNAKTTMAARLGSIETPDLVLRRGVPIRTDQRSGFYRNLEGFLRGRGTR